MHQVSYAAVGRALTGAQVSVLPSEAHGWLCGALCGRQAPSADAWFQELIEADFADQAKPKDSAGEKDGQPFEQLYPDSAASDVGMRHGALHELYDQTLSTLEQGEMLVAPLLPDDDAPLERRAESLALWCEGFLYGLGTHKSLPGNSLSPEVREIVSDFAAISRAGTVVTEADQAEEEEEAYAELVEFVRVSAQLLHDELSRDRHP